jgi:hypothetical protein
MYVGIPVDTVDSLMVYGKEAGALILRDKSSADIYFSLPLFFGARREALRHGIILKGSAGADGRHVLLVPVVEREEDIPEEEIHTMPGILADIGRVSFISGIRFTDSAMTLFIDPAKFINNILSENPDALQGTHKGKE